MHYIIATSSSSAAPYSGPASAAIMPQSSSGREYLTVRSPRYIWFKVYSSDVSVCSRLSAFSSHSHTVMQCHPMAASSCCTLLSRLPTKEEELRILELYMEEDPLKSLTAVVSLEELLAARAEAAKIFVHPCIREYMVQIAEATRRADGILAGVSPRGTLGLLRCVKAYAYLQGRSYVIPDDVRTLAVPVLAHRLVCSFGSDTGSAAGRMENILSTVPVPTERFEP